VREIHYAPLARAEAVWEPRKFERCHPHIRNVTGQPAITDPLLSNGSGGHPIRRSRTQGAEA
jgi:hypothetical protein